MGSSAPTAVEARHTHTAPHTHSHSHTQTHTHSPPTQAQSPCATDTGRAPLRLGQWQGEGPAHLGFSSHERLSTAGALGPGAALPGTPTEHPQHHAVERTLRERAPMASGGDRLSSANTGASAPSVPAQSGAPAEHQQHHAVERTLRERALAAGGAPAQQPQQPQQTQPPQQHAVDLTLRERALAAGAAAVLSAVIMNPLDVAKTRLQAQAAGYSYSQAVTGAPCNNCGSPWPDPITRRHLALYQLNWLPQASDVGGFRDASHARAAVNVSRAGLPFAAAGAAACQVSCDFPAPSSSKAYRGPLDVVTRIVREEGVSRLWRGTSAGLLMAVPTVAIYMPVYDSLRARLEEGDVSWTAPYAPLIAGAASRSLSCLLCAPLELARTRLQAASQAGTGMPGGAPSAGLQQAQGVLGILREAVQGAGGGARAGAGAGAVQGAGGGARAGAGAGAGAGVHAAGAGTAARGAMDAFAQVARLRVLWRGVDAHLARDVPFSAICWSALEPMRKALLALGSGTTGGVGEEWGSVEEREQNVGLGRVLAANFTAGVVAGSFAAAVTTPLDVAKTRVQIEICAHSAGRGLAYHLGEVYREGGWRALYAGAGPRSLKAGPSVGIIVSFYEIIKYVFSKTLHEQ